MKRGRESRPTSWGNKTEDNMTFEEKVQKWDNENRWHGRCLHIHWKKRLCWIMDVYPDGVSAYGPYPIDDETVMASFVW